MPEIRYEGELESLYVDVEVDDGETEELDICKSWIWREVQRC